ncbi:MAG: PSD1 and planctomycete cytochrome C domain-containing protein, partial [Fimbriimonas sp.]
MKPKISKVVTLAAAVGLVCFSLSTDVGTVQEPTADQLAFFEAKVRPVLSDNCFKCHGKDTQMAGLRLDSFEAIQQAKVIIPGDPDKSLLVQAVRYTGPTKMPKGGPLKPEQVNDIEAWVKMGAPWPKAPEKPKEKPLWSLQPVRNPIRPRVRLASWPKNAIDFFVLAKLEANNLKPAPPADKRTLLRRLSYDLTGLPPTAAEVDAFLADKSPGAYTKQIDRLLASPSYGERWARLWLDVARYADTKGYVFEEDRTYPNAYTYREWVINAFNRDLPYTEFIAQQLAADRLPEVQNGDDKTPLAALGFLTVGRRFLNNPPDIIDDRIDVTMRGFQGFTVACARCHDHKFDPIPTQDYYSLFAIFAASEETMAPISEKPIRDPWIAHNQQATARETAIRDLTLAQIKRLRTTEQSGEIKSVLQALREDQIPDASKLALLSVAFEPNENTHLKQLQTELADLRKNAPKTPEFAMAMVDRPNPTDGVVYRRGNPGMSGEPAPRRFLKALSSGEREHWNKSSGRLELAKAIASKDNPLTARVFVNRVWQNHFGAGIVRTPSDFGHQGEPPTHPELLDFLAITFMENGWSIKKLHRLILTSATYQQSSSVDAKTYNKDPENRTWSRMNRRRLDLEQMRDSLLYASGKLDTKQIGGKSVNLWSQPFVARRAIYGFVERQNLPGIFRTFDFASPDSTSPRRFMTTVPQQALFFMNSPLSVEQAQALAESKEMKSAQDDSKRVRLLYRRLFTRQPDPDELASGVAYLGKGSVQAPVSAWRYGYGASPKFTPLTYFAENGYRVGPAFPDPALGWLLLNAQGGHPGHDANHSIIRRWTAPVAMTVNVRGILTHPTSQGDGIRGRVITNRGNVLGDWKVLNGKAQTEMLNVSVLKGDTLDFAVDPIGTEFHDAFGWAPVIETIDGKQKWDAAKSFAPARPSVSRLALYIQAL